MKWITVDEYRLSCYTPESRPTRRTIIRLIKSGAIRGKQQGRLFYVDMDYEGKVTGNPLVDRVMLDH